MDRDLERLEEVLPDRHGYRTPEEPGPASPRLEDAVHAAMERVAHHGNGSSRDLAAEFMATAKRRLSDRR